MNEPMLYIHGNTVQRQIAKQLIEEFSGLLQLRSDGKDSLMDVGCGTGDVLIDFILPILPKTHSKVVGTDFSPRMIQYSNKAYAEYDRVKFKVLDIGTDKMPLEYHEQFDHVTSFNCLHWVQNLREAFKNIYDMLTNDGDCLLVFVSSAHWFDVFYLLAADPKWSEYMKDVDKFVPPLQKQSNPWLVCTNLLKEAGFTYQRIEIRQKVIDYEGYENFRKCLTAVNPFHERLPVHKREEFMDDMCEYYKYPVYHNQIIVYARK